MDTKDEVIHTVDPENNEDSLFMETKEGIHDLDKQSTGADPVHRIIELVVGFFMMILIGCICSFILGTMLFFAFSKRVSDEMNVRKDSYEIVDYFACSDYCPGDPNQYMVRIYKGVETEDECRDIGGDPTYIEGWKSEFICVVR